MKTATKWQIKLLLPVNFKQVKIGETYTLVTIPCKKDILVDT